MGSISHGTHDKHRYFITIVDDYSRCTWKQLLTCKSNTLVVIKNFLSMIENQFNTRVQTITTGNGLEFVNTETSNFLEGKGIIHERTCPYTPTKWGVERKYKYLLETSRPFFFNTSYLLSIGVSVYCVPHTSLIDFLPPK